MTGRQLTLDDALDDQPAADCDPTWLGIWQPSDRTPTRAELSDLHDQRASAYALRRARTVPTRHYL